MRLLHWYTINRRVKLFLTKYIVKKKKKRSATNKLIQLIRNVTAIMFANNFEATLPEH